MQEGEDRSLVDEEHDKYMQKKRRTNRNVLRAMGIGKTVCRQGVHQGHGMLMKQRMTA